MKKISTLFKVFAAMLFAMPAVPGQAQQPQVNTIQPTIMVVPFTKEGEDIRTVLEADVNKRAVLTAIKEAFDNRGFTTVDFLGKIRATSTQAAFKDDSKSSLLSDILANSGADIYITAEIDINKSSQGTSVNIILNAFDNYTGNSLGNKNGNSGRFYTDDIVKLANVAIKKNMDPFLDNMQVKFNDMVINGRSLRIDFSFDEASEYDMDTDLNDDGYLLSDLIIAWMEDNAYKNYAHTAGAVAESLIFDDVKVPLKDPKTKRNFNVNSFAGSITRYLKSLGLESTRRVNGNQIYIIIK